MCHSIRQHPSWRKTRLDEELLNLGTPLTKIEEFRTLCRAFPEDTSTSLPTWEAGCGPETTISFHTISKTCRWNKTPGYMRASTLLIASTPNLQIWAKVMPIVCASNVYTRWTYILVQNNQTQLIRGWTKSPRIGGLSQRLAQRSWLKEGLTLLTCERAFVMKLEGKEHVICKVEKII